MLALWLQFILLILVIFFLKILIDLLRNEAIFVPLPKGTIRKILRLANVSEQDVVYDLGSGDGRVLVIAAEEFGAKAVGIEKNWLLYKLSKWKIRKSKLSNRIKIIHDNFFNQKISDATVIVVYLSKKLNNELEPKLKEELKKGTRIVSAAHQFSGLKLVKKIKTGHFYSYLYII